MTLVTALLVVMLLIAVAAALAINPNTIYTGRPDDQHE